MRNVLRLLLLVLASLPSYSQTLGEISGLVTDSTGAVVPGASVTVTNEGTNAARTVKSNEVGLYTFPSLLPRQQFWDFSAHKAFRIREGHDLTFRVETFNFANHPSWGSPMASWGSTSSTPGVSFGRIRSTAASMRQIQLGLKYVF